MVTEEKSQDDQETKHFRVQFTLSANCTEDLNLVRFALLTANWNERRPVLGFDKEEPATEMIKAVDFSGQLEERLVLHGWVENRDTDLAEDKKPYRAVEAVYGTKQHDWKRYFSQRGSVRLDLETSVDPSELDETGWMGTTRLKQLDRRIDRAQIVIDKINPRIYNLLGFTCIRWFLETPENDGGKVWSTALIHADSRFYQLNR